MKKLSSIDNKWFFTDLHPIFKYLTFFVKGDLIILVPLVAAILLLGFISIKFMLVMVGAYLALRYFGEMIYWLLQQFSDRSYRPGDFGFKKLDNHAIYIIYQTIALAWVMAGIGIILAAFWYLE